MPCVSSCVFGFERRVWPWNSLNNQPCWTPHAYITHWDWEVGPSHRSKSKSKFLCDFLRTLLTWLPYRFEVAFGFGQHLIPWPWPDNTLLLRLKKFGWNWTATVTPFPGKCTQKRRNLISSIVDMSCVLSQKLTEMSHQSCGHCRPTSDDEEEGRPKYVPTSSCYLLLKVFHEPEADKLAIHDNSAAERSDSYF